MCREELAKRAGTGTFLRLISLQFQEIPLKVQDLPHTHTHTRVPGNWKEAEVPAAINNKRGLLLKTHFQTVWGSPIDFRQGAPVTAAWVGCCRSSAVRSEIPRSGSWWLQHTRGILAGRPARRGNGREDFASTVNGGPKPTLSPGCPEEPTLGLGPAQQTRPRPRATPLSGSPRLGRASRALAPRSALPSPTSRNSSSLGVAPHLPLSPPGA